MRVRIWHLFLVVAIFSFTASACSSFRSGPLPPLQITEPHNNDVFGLNQNINVRLVSNANQDHTWDTFEYEIYQDGLRVRFGTADGTQNNINVQLMENTNGTHVISAQVRGHRHDVTSDWIQSNQVCFYVGDNAPADFCSVQTIIEPQQASRPTSTPTPPPNPIDNVQAYPNPIYYGNSCPSLSTVTFRTALTLPNGTTPDQVQVAAHASFIISSVANPSGSLLIPLTSNGTWDSSTGGQVFLGTAALTHSYNDANNQFDPASLGESSGAILWYVTVMQNNASLARSGNQVISLSPCPVNGQNPQHNSNNGSNPATGCGQYTNQTSCDLAGCSWNPQGSSCTVNP